MKKIILGLAVVAMAAATSAFTNATTNTGKLDTRTLVFDQTSGQYQEVLNYDPEKCEPGTNICSYTTEESSSVVPSAFDANDINLYIMHLEQNGEDSKQYLDPNP